MKEQTKKIWDGSIEHTAVGALGGEILRTNEQEKRNDAISIVVCATFVEALRAVLEEVNQVTDNHQWSDIGIKVIIEIAPQKKTAEQ